MSRKIKLTPIQKSENLHIESADFPGQLFNYHVPEAIGSTDPENTYFSTADPTPAKPDWKPFADKGWRYTWTQAHLLAYTVEAVPGEDTIDVKITLKNLSGKTWPQSHAFPCCNFHKAASFSDFEGTRTFLLIDGEWKSLMQIQRKDSIRPLVQLFYVQGKPRPLGCVERFEATPPIYPQGIFAVRSYDSKSVIAVTADKPLYLFHNMEYSCIHCCPGFGSLKPGEQGTATNRVFIGKNTSLHRIAERAKSLWISG